jgi:arylsulfatase A-like enzyme
MLPGRGREVASNAPLRSGGTTCYEGGVRVPALFRLPGRIPAGSTVTAMLSQLDLVPLALGLASLPLPADRVLDGRDPLPALAGQAPAPHARLGFAYAGTTALREGPLKLVRPAPAAPWELYDVEADPGESRDLAAGRPDEVRRLAAAHAAWMADLARDASPRAPWTPPARRR